MLRFDITPQARAYVEALPVADRYALFLLIRDLLTRPDRHPDSSPLETMPDLRRIDRNGHRMVYRIRDGVLRVPVIERAM